MHLLKTIFSISFFTISYCYSIQQIIAPNISNCKIIGYASGLRPCRQGGIRIEGEFYKDKFIIHDYGHGGSGITLSWGSAHLALEILENHLINHSPDVKDIAVIGSGVIGLSTAHLLLDKGYKVHLYAKEFPPNTTSDLAPAIWSKILVALDLSEERKQQLKTMEDFSFEIFQELANADHPRLKGVSFIDTYTFKKSLQTIKSTLPPKLSETCKSIEIQFQGNSIIKKGVFFRIILIDSSIYMQELYEQLKQRDALCTTQIFSSIEDINTLSESIIFNCTGLGSQELFQDKALFGVRGQLIYLTPQEGVDCVIAGPQPHPSLDIYVIPLKDKIVLGGSYEFSTKTTRAYNPCICKQILKHTHEFFKK